MIKGMTSNRQERETTWAIAAETLTAEAAGVGYSGPHRAHDSLCVQSLGWRSHGRSRSFRKPIKGRGFLRTPHHRESCSSILAVLQEGYCSSHRSPWFTVLPAPFRSSNLWENLGTRSRKDFSRWRCWGEKRGGAEGVPCPGMGGLPRVDALGAV